MKQDLDNTRESAIQCIMKRLKAKGLEVTTYESNLNDVTFFNSTVFSVLEQFKQKSAVIAANRIVAELNDVVDKVYTRDLFGEN